MTRRHKGIGLVNLKTGIRFLVANRNSIRWFVRPSVGRSVRHAFFLTAENAKILLNNEFQSPMKVICKRARAHAHLHVRSIRNYWSRAGLVFGKFV